MRHHPDRRRQERQGRRRAAKSQDQYVELSREKTDKIFVILAEFGNERHPSYPDQDTDPATPGPTTLRRPAAQQDPAPDRTVDNSHRLAAELRPRSTSRTCTSARRQRPATSSRVKQYYERQSSGRYSVDGSHRLGQGALQRGPLRPQQRLPLRGQRLQNTWNLVRDAHQRVGRRPEGRRRSTDAQIKAELASFDQWDRNDFDDDGNFNEPDGYIDHFQIVHAGGDQADGDPIQGEDAIWSHRWKAFQNTGQGPAANKDGGTQIGNTGLWVARLHDPARERRRSACSRTSTATTSACRTTTTPPARRRTPSTSGR